MKITSGKKDDILKKKEAYERDRSERQSKYDEQRGKFNVLRKSILDEVEAQVEGLLRSVNLDLEISAREENIGLIKITVGTPQTKLFDESSALTWTWSAELDSDGVVHKTSNSYSGLKATTSEHIDFLRESVKTLDILNTANWETILAKTLPKYEEYVTEKNPEWETKPNFDRELLEAEIEELIGTDTMIGGTNERARTSNITNWFIVLKETPKQYKVADIPAYAISPEHIGDMTVEEVIEKNKRYSYNISKEKFLSIIKRPLVTKEA